MSSSADVFGTVVNAPLRLSEDGDLGAAAVTRSERRLAQLEGIFADETERLRMDQDRVVYEVASFFPIPAGTTGGLFFGFTRIFSGRVGNEYFMTRGHFHAERDRAEYYWCTRGRGWLLLMDSDRRCRAEILEAGSVSYIPANTAHRMVNVGDDPLCFGACWPSDAGHDYATIAEVGFSARVLARDGGPELVDERD